MSKQDKSAAASESQQSEQPDLMLEMKEFYEGKRRDLVRQVSEIESFLGFVVQSDDLAVRVAKLEAFVGLNKG